MTIRYAPLINEVGNSENRRWLMRRGTSAKLVSDTPAFCCDEMWETSWDARDTATNFLEAADNYSWTCYGIFMFSQKPSKDDHTGYGYVVEVELIEEPPLDD